MMLHETACSAPLIPPRSSQVPAECRPSRTEPASVGDEVHVDLLSFNAKGLPGVLGGGDEDDRNRRIGSLVSRYDVVLLQEDFEYHDLLVGSGAFGIAVRGNGPSRDPASLVARTLLLPLRLVPGLRSGPPYGSGLAILARGDPSSAAEVTRETLPGCAGWTSDCWAAKGFLRVRLRLANDAQVDVYDTHLASGYDAASRAVRRLQLRWLADRVERLSAGRAVIVGGDFNSSYADPFSTVVPIEGRTGADYVQLDEEFVERLHLADSGAHPVDLDPRDQLDYLFYRSGASADIAVLNAGGEDRCLRGLSDHLGIRATMRVSNVRRTNVSAAESEVHMQRTAARAAEPPSRQTPARTVDPRR
jgi:endonuclease/exonuclease/phosphatase family metal-dependent hydrolase